MVSICIVQLLNLATIVSTFLVSSVASQKCEHPLPILMKTASGVDITKLDFLPIDGSSSSSNRYDGFVENVFNFTCNGTKWHDNQNSNDTTQYDIPDAFEDINSWGSGASYSIALNLLDAKTSKAALVDQLVTHKIPIKMLFSHSRKDQSLLKQYFDSGKMFAQITDETKYHEFLLDLSKTALSNDFLEFINQKLAAKYEDNPANYQQFIQRFGTHFIHQGQFGFMHTLQFALNPQYAIEHTDVQIMRNVMVAFYRAFNRSLTLIDDRGHSILDNVKTAQVDEEFDKHSEVILSFGGQTSKWVDKVSGKTFLAENNSDRVLLSVHLYDLGELIKNKTVKAQVQIAIRMYTIKAYLDEFANVYNYTNYQLSNEEKASLVQVETMIDSSDTQNMDQMEQIINQLYDNISVFTDRKLCYPTLYDLYVTANVKLNFAKYFCEYSPSIFFQRNVPKCVSDDIVDEQRQVNILFGSYEHEEQSLACVKEVRELNEKFDILNDRDKGLKVNCGHCN